MNWWLVYEEEDIERNRAYIDMFFRSCSSRNISLELLRTPDAFKRINSLSEALPSVVINRSRDISLSLILEEKGTAVYNNSQITKLGNDKLAAINFAEDLGLPVMKTSVSPGDPGWPMIAKSISGHGGTEVFMLKDPSDLEELEKKDIFPLRRWIYQEVASDTGRDLRIYVIGKRIIGSMMRSSDTDFRSNYCLGGQASVHTLTAEEYSIARTIIDTLDIGHCGIDLIYDHGSPVFNEIEDAVGTRMLYRYTDIDAVEEYVDYISHSEGANK
ncbi:MAG: hypothetical protein K6C99_02890 [Lachnospiraceae bacterium]|nr:hypothetical protein [Lachnospiraceae bacterium]